MRNVTVFNTQGQNRQVVATSATTWGDLKADLTRQGVSYNGMKTVIGESQLTLESAEASLPDGDFTLFMLPQKVKSGYEDEIEEEEDYEEDYEDDEDTEDCGCTDEISSQIAAATSGLQTTDVTVESISNRLRTVCAEVQSIAADVSKLADKLNNPEVHALRDQADKLRKNLDLFN